MSIADGKSVQNYVISPSFMDSPLVANDKFDVEWSVARGDYPALETQDLNNYTERLPNIANGAELILVETWEDYNPVFRVGLAPLAELAARSAQA